MLGQGDVLTVHLYGMQDYTPIVRVALDGTIDLPLAGGLSVDGLSLHQAEELIARRLTGRDVQTRVSIQLTESPNESVTLTGELHGIIPVAGQSELFDVLSRPGGIPSDGESTVINRPGVAEPIVVDLSAILADGLGVPVFRATFVPSPLASARSPVQALLTEVMPIADSPSPDAIWHSRRRRRV